MSDSFRHVLVTLEKDAPAGVHRSVVQALTLIRGVGCLSPGEAFADADRRRASVVRADLGGDLHQMVARHCGTRGVFTSPVPAAGDLMVTFDHEAGSEDLAAYETAFRALRGVAGVVRGPVTDVECLLGQDDVRASLARHLHEAIEAFFAGCR
jgi:hypothetical protein